MAKLRKQLGLLDVYCIAIGAMISSGLFILPALIFIKTGPAIIVAYLLASILIIPSVLAKAELATAMPKAGGVYFYIDRSFGCLWGIFSGLSGWFALSLKSAFAIVGMVILVEMGLVEIFQISLTPIQHKIIATICCLFFTGLNIVSVKHTSKFQVVLVFLLLLILGGFLFRGVMSIEIHRYKDFMPFGFKSTLAAAGMVFISFAGLTKVAAVAEEIKNPGKNLPLGMILAWATTTFLYLAVITVTVGVVDRTAFLGSSLPISLAASNIAGTLGYVLLTFAAAAAFITTANGGLLAASRAPLAMSKDKILPSFFANISHRFRTPHASILVTGLFMTVAIVAMDIELLVKTASTLGILLFMMINASLIIMRESKIQSYRPKFRAPFYPYINILAIIIYGILIIDMGIIPLSITAGFIILSIVWYLVFVAKRTKRASAIMHIVERVTAKELHTVTLENELRDILLDRDQVVEDRFDGLIRNCEILDMTEPQNSASFFRHISASLEKKLDVNEYVLFEKFIKRQDEGTIIVSPGMAIPHVIVDGENKFEIMLVRAANGIIFPDNDTAVTTLFVLAGSHDQRPYHLRALMAIAQIVQQKNFTKLWLNARDTEGIRNLMLLSARNRDS